MRGLIELALNNGRAVTVSMLAIIIVGILCLWQIPMDVLPVYDRPAVQILTFYSGMPADNMAHAITNRMERWTGTASNMLRQESRTILGVSIVRNYFRSGADPSGALTEVNSLALGVIPNLPPGTLPPVVLPFDPTATIPACIVAVDSETQNESTLYDVARYEVRNMVMAIRGANAPVVFGGKVRAILAYVDPLKLQARNLTPLDVMEAISKYNLFLPTGDIRIGDMDYAIDSNAMVPAVEKMKEIPLRVKPDGTDFLEDVATPKDAYMIQMNAVRLMSGAGASGHHGAHADIGEAKAGHRVVYIPVYPQHGASTLSVVGGLQREVPNMPARLTRPNISLKLVMDQSVYVWQSIQSLAMEGILGAVLCSLVILLFLGQWRMTLISVLTIPIAVLAAITGLYATGNTINVMTLAGLALAIGPLVDSAIISLENTERHLMMGDSPRKAALLGASEVALPELVASLSTLLVLAPLALMPGSGQFLFRPMALAVAFAMGTAYILSRSFVPSRCAKWLKGHTHEPAAEHHGAAGHQPQYKGFFGKIQWAIDAATNWYARRLNWVLSHRLLTVGLAVVLLATVCIGLGPNLRREFFPEVDAGAFEMYVRAKSGTRLEATEKRIAELEKYIYKTVGTDLQLVLSDMGTQPDWSAAYTPNAGPMDAVMKIQLLPHRIHTSQFYARKLREGLEDDSRFNTLEFAFNTGGTIRSALNEGKASPISIRVESKNPESAVKIAQQIRDVVKKIDGVVDARVMQRIDYPEYFISVDRGKARALGLTQEEIMKNVVAALKSSIQFNKRNFWIDPVSQNQYFVGVQYPEGDIQSLDSMLNVSITSPQQKQPIPLGNLVKIDHKQIPAEVTHLNLRAAIDLTMNVEGRDLGHVADDITRELNRFGKHTESATWLPYDPSSRDQKLLPGSRIVLSGEYEFMQNMFINFAIGMILAVTFIYFLMVMLLDSYIIPLVVMSAVPVGLVGVLPMLFITGTAINVQSLLGVIFMVGIVVSNTVLLTDFAKLIHETEGLNATEAIRKAAVIRARPVVMTALAALFALIPMALALEKGSEANAPLGRAVIGGLVAGLLTTLLVVPALFSLLVRFVHPEETHETTGHEPQTGHA